MLAEALHSLVDILDQLFLLVGIHRASRPADDEHPFGFGLETYFWSFAVALLIFALGGAASVYEGVIRILHPQALSRPWINYLVLAPRRPSRARRSPSAIASFVARCTAGASGCGAFCG